MTGFAEKSIRNLQINSYEDLFYIIYTVQVQHVNPTELPLKIKLEEQVSVNRYLLDLKEEIGTQIQLLKPNTITEAQTHAMETDMWLSESEPARTNDTGRSTRGNRLRRLSRVSAVCTRLRSIRARRRTGSYQLLVNSGAVINLIKEVLDK